MTYRDSEIAQTVSAQLPGNQQDGSQITEKENKRLVYKDLSVVQELSAVFSLSWSHYVFLTAIKDEQVRSFYEIEAVNGNWSLWELVTKGIEKTV